MGPKAGLVACEWEKNLLLPADNPALIRLSLSDYTDWATKKWNPLFEVEKESHKDKKSCLFAAGMERQVLIQLRI
jgi:hypothetical protein